MLLHKRNELLDALWEHQEVSLERIADAIDRGVRRLVLQLPTGAGKTETAIAQTWLYLQAWEDQAEKMMSEGVPISDVMRMMEQRTPFVWLTDRQELNKQTAMRFKKWGLNVAPLTSQNFPNQYAGMDPWKAVQMFGKENQGMVISPTVFTNRFMPEKFNDRSLLFVDEMQHSRAPTWRKPIQDFPGTVIGLSATPERVNPREGFDDIYEELIQTVQIKDLEDKGILAPVVVQAPPTHLRVYGSRPVAGDYTQFNVTGSERVFNEGAVRYVFEQARDRQFIWYTYNQAHCVDLARMMAKFVPAEKLAIVLSKTNDSALDYAGEGFVTDREEVVNKTQSGELWGIFNVMVYTEGVDAHNINCIVTDRPTISPIVWNQQVGRGRRVDPNFDYCLVIDFTGNTEDLGHPSQGRQYFLEPRNKKPPTRPAPSKECPDCQMRCAPSCQLCPNCGYSFGQDCPTCYKFRPWKRWRMGKEWSHDEHRCDMCQMGAKPPMMFQNGFNDHLKDEILRLEFEPASWHNNHHRIVWRTETNNVYQIEQLVKNDETDKMAWLLSSDDVTDIENYAVVIDQRSLRDRDARDLYEKGALYHLVELQLLDEDKWQKIESEGLDAVFPPEYVYTPPAIVEPEPAEEEPIDEEAFLNIVEGLPLFSDEYRWHLHKDLHTALRNVIANLEQDLVELEKERGSTEPEEDDWEDDIDEWLDIEPSVVDFVTYTYPGNWKESSRKNGVYSYLCPELNVRVWVGNDKRGYGYVWGVYPEPSAYVPEKAKQIQKTARGRSSVVPEFAVAIRQSYDVLVGMHGDGIFEVAK